MKLYGLLYNQGNSQMFHFYDSWETAYTLLFHMGRGSSLWCLETSSPIVFVKVVEI